MTILFDVNVLLDVSHRYRAYPHSLVLYRQVVTSPRHTGALAASSYTTLAYFLHREIGPHRARRVLHEWSTRLLWVPLSLRAAQAATRSPMADFEDACLALSGWEGQCDIIATRNVRDFVQAPVPALTPEALLAQL